MSYFNRPWDRAESKYRGLTNQGSTCYLNSVLQVLFMTKEFREAVQRFCICSSETSHTSYIDAQLKDLFLQLETGSPTTEYIIQYIIHRLGIEVWKQQDAAEYFEKILSLASPEASQVFCGNLIHHTTCSLCDESTDEHNSFWTLNLPINNTSIGVYNVEEGLKGFLSQSKLTGDNQVYCDGCEAKADTTTECEVELHPKVLVLLLKRFEFSYYEMNYVKNDCPVDVPLNIETPKTGVSYELYATVDHVGSLRGGHYSATIQSPDNGGSWFNFNDSTVTPKNNFNPEKSQDGYLLFYRKTQMSDSPQEDHRGSSVDPAESETNQNNADNDSEDNFNTTPSSSGPMDEQPVWAGRGDVTGGDEVKGDDDVRAGVDVTKCGDEVVAGVDVTGRGDVTGGDEVMVGVGDTQPMESERLDGKGGECIKRDLEVPTNEMESHEPGDHAVQPEASGTGPMVSDPEGVNERKRRGQREGLLDVKGGEGETAGAVIEKTDDGNTDPHSDGDDNHTTPSSSGPMDEQQVRAGRGEVTGGDEVTEEVEAIECDEVTGGDGVIVGVDAMECDDVMAVDPQPMEIQRLNEIGGERMKTVAVPTNEIESREPGDHTVQPEASGTGPMVRYLEGGVNKKKRRRRKEGEGKRESTALLEVEVGGRETEGNVMERKHGKVIDNPNCSFFSGMCFSFRPRCAKSKRGPGKRVSKGKKSIQPRRKTSLSMCWTRQTSDTE